MLAVVEEGEPEPAGRFSRVGGERRRDVAPAPHPSYSVALTAGAGATVVVPP